MTNKELQEELNDALIHLKKYHENANVNFYKKNDKLIIETFKEDRIND